MTVIASINIICCSLLMTIQCLCITREIMIALRIYQLCNHEGDGEMRPPLYPRTSFGVRPYPMRSRWDFWGTTQCHWHKKCYSNT